MKTRDAMPAIGKQQSFSFELWPTQSHTQAAPAAGIGGVAEVAGATTARPAVLWGPMATFAFQFEFSARVFSLISVKFFFFFFSGDKIINQR